MSLRSIKVNGRKVRQARVAFKGLRKSTIRDTKQKARDAEADLLCDLQEQAGQAGQAAQGGAAPATMWKLFEFYAEDMKNHGKGEGSRERVEQIGKKFARQSRAA